MLEEEFLCDTLKGRVSYFVTRYRGAHDERGRACIRVGGKEVLNMPFVADYEKNIETHKRKDAGAEGPLRDIYLSVEDEFNKRGRFEPNLFGVALHEYFNAPIGEALQSEDPLVRMLAVLDRRVCKRTLQVLRQKAAEEPEWLRYFYELRLQSEGLEK